MSEGATVDETAEQFCDLGGGITLCYETFGDRGDPPLLLVMGLGTQMIGWHHDLCRSLSDRGLFVVRYDNRDSGRSTHLDLPAPTLAQLVRRRFAPGQYTLTDMAGDAARLLRELDLAPAHVVGASMGGMIAQTLAVRNPDTVRSLVSIMSSTGHRFRGQPRLGVYGAFLRRRPREREAFIEHMVAVYEAIGSPEPLRDPEHIREVAGRSWDRDNDARAPGRQLAAVLASGDRTRELGRIRAPTLVLHGSEDRLVAPSGGRATARAIGESRAITVEGMGHDLPRALWSRLIHAIAGHALDADARQHELQRR